MALFSADCKSPPELTVLVLPGAGVFDIADWMKIRGNSAGPSNPLASLEETVRVKASVALCPEESVTFAAKGYAPISAVIPVMTPLELCSCIPDGRAPVATFQW